MPAATVFEAMYRDPSQGLGRYLFLFFCFFGFFVLFYRHNGHVIIIGIRYCVSQVKRQQREGCTQNAPTRTSNRLQYPRTVHQPVASTYRCERSERGRKKKVQITIHATHCRENCPPLEGAVPCSNGFPVKFHFHVPLCRSTACSAPSNVPT